MLDKAIFDKYWDIVAEEMFLTLTFSCSEQMDLCKLCENLFIDFLKISFS